MKAIDDEERSWLKDQLRRGLSYTVLSAIWLGRLNPAQRAERELKKARDKKVIDMILAGYPPPKTER